MHPVHIIVLNFEYPLIFDTPAKRGHKTLQCLLPYLLLAHVSELLANSLLPFSTSLFFGMMPGFVEYLGLILIMFDVAGHDGQINYKL